jgi:hypothetical protein
MPYPARCSQLRSINALTLCTSDMHKACDFYSKLGLIKTYGGPGSSFTTFSAHAPVRPVRLGVGVGVCASVPKGNSGMQVDFIVTRAMLPGQQCLACQPISVPCLQREGRVARMGPLRVFRGRR